MNVEESQTVTRVGSSKCPILSSARLIVVLSTDPARTSLGLGTGLPDGFGFLDSPGRVVPEGTVASPGGTFVNCSTARGASGAYVVVLVGRTATPRDGSHPLLHPFVTWRMTVSVLG